MNEELNETPTLEHARIEPVQNRRTQFLMLCRKINTRVKAQTAVTAADSKLEAFNALPTQSAAQ